MEVEVWKSIECYEGMYKGLYEVSSFGRVKSLGNSLKRKEKILKPGLGSAGYLIVGLCVDCKAKSRVIQRLVAYAFLEGLTENLEVNHIDGDKQNNKVSNLEIVTRTENIRHAFRTGLNRAISSERKPTAKFDIDAVKNLRSTYAAGNHSISELARMNKVSQSTMSDIINNKSWVNV